MESEKNKFGKPLKNVNVGIIALLLCVITLFMLSIFSDATITELIEGVQVELFGVLFDIIVLIILFNYLNEKNLKSERIKRYKEELDDYRGWTESLAAFRVAGIVRRLEQEGITKIDLSNLHLGKVSSDRVSKSIKNNQTISSLEGVVLVNWNISNIVLIETNFRNAKMYGSKILDSNLSECDFSTSKLSRSKFTNTNLVNANFQDSDLVNAEFKEVDLSYANFKGANLVRSVFENVSLMGVKLQGSDFQNTNLIEVKVDSHDWFDKLMTWNVKGVEEISKNHSIEIRIEKVDNNKEKTTFIVNNKKTYI